MPLCHLTSVSRPLQRQSLMIAFCSSRAATKRSMRKSRSVVNGDPPSTAVSPSHAPAVRVGQSMIRTGANTCGEPIDVLRLAARALTLEQWKALWPGIAATWTCTHWQGPSECARTVRAAGTPEPHIQSPWRAWPKARASIPPKGSSASGVLPACGRWVVASQNLSNVAASTNSPSFGTGTCPHNDVPREPGLVAVAP